MTVLKVDRCLLTALMAMSQKLTSKRAALIFRSGVGRPEVVLSGNPFILGQSAVEQSINSRHYPHHTHSHINPTLMTLTFSPRPKPLAVVPLTESVQLRIYHARGPFRKAPCITCTEFLAPRLPSSPERPPCVCSVPIRKPAAKHMHTFSYAEQGALAPDIPLFYGYPNGPLGPDSKRCTTTLVFA
jgi:hypothetical protein